MTTENELVLTAQLDAPHGADTLPEHEADAERRFATLTSRIVVLQVELAGAKARGGMSAADADRIVKALKGLPETVTATQPKQAGIPKPDQLDAPAGEAKGQAEDEGPKVEDKRGHAHRAMFKEARKTRIADDGPLNMR